MTSEQLPVQLSLKISLRDEATFANFYTGQANAVAVNALRAVCEGGDESNILIWGANGSGLSHLLQASCHSASLTGLSVSYLPLTELAQYDPELVFEGLEDVFMVCLDGVESVVGKPEWEKALFHLYNRLRDRNVKLLLAAQQSPASLDVKLPDLRSRILGCVIYKIHRLNDEDKCRALKLRAGNRGMDLSDEVARYILSRLPRDFSNLQATLDVLDESSLQQQRRLTIPFVKSVLAL